MNTQVGHLNLRKFILSISVIKGKIGWQRSTPSLTSSSWPALCKSVYNTKQPDNGRDSIGQARLPNQPTIQARDGFALASKGTTERLCPEDK